MYWRERAFVLDLGWAGSKHHRRLSLCFDIPQSRMAIGAELSDRMLGASNDVVLRLT